MTVEGDKLPITPRVAGVVFGVFVFGAAMSVSGCSSVPDEMNPVEWYEGTLDFFTGEEEDDELAAALEQPSPGENEEFPNLASVPDRPEVSDPEERQRIAEGLVADRQARQYADPITVQGPAVSTLATAAPAVPQAAVASEVDAEPEPIATVASVAPEPTLPEPASGTPEGAAGVGGTSAPPATPAAIEATQLSPPAEASPSLPTLQSATPPPAAPSESSSSPSATAPPPPLGSGVAAATPPPALPEVAPRPMTARPPVAAPDRVPQLPAPAPPAALPPAPANALVPSVGDPFETVVVSSAGVAAGSVQAGPGFASPTVGLPGAVPAGAASAFPSGNSIKVATIQFAHGSSKLSRRDVGILRNVLQVHRERGGRIRIVGHASSRTQNMDPVRHKMVNYQISVDRAKSIASELTRLGAPADRIVVTAQSDEQPVYYEIMPSGEAGNRRAEIFIDL